MLKDNYQAFTEHFLNLKKIQNNQKLRGLNDFNIFSTLLKPHDEVRLHSRFISSLLNIQGEHYQSNLFLDLFLRSFSPVDFNFNSEKAECYVEYENIDIFLTDGDRNIIIENKIYAQDQSEQIKRYIDLIREKNPKLNGESVWVIYLSLDRDRPSDISLGESSGYLINQESNKLEQGTFSAFYSSLNYPTDILGWLEQCLKEVENLNDLSVIIKQYKDVVLKLIGTYESKVMSLQSYIDQLEESDRISFLKILLEVEKDLPSMRNKVMRSFFEKVQICIQKNLEKMRLLDEGWKLDFDGVDKLTTRFGYPLRVSHKDYPLMFGMEFSNNNFHDLGYGVVIDSKKIDMNVLYNSNDFKSLVNKAEKKLSFISYEEGWWPSYTEHEGSLFELILNKGEQSMCNEVCSQFESYIVSFIEVCRFSKKYLVSK